MKLIQFWLLFLIVVASTSVWAEGEGEGEQPQPVPEQPQPEPEQPQPEPEQLEPEQQPMTELTVTTPAPVAIQSAPESTVEYTDFRMTIDHSLGNVLVQIIDWQASMFDYIQSNLSPLSNHWDAIKSSIRTSKANEELTIRSTDVGNSRALLQQQVVLLKEALSKGNQIETILVLEQQTIDQWISEVNAYVEGALSRKADISAALDTMVSSAKNDIKETKSSIQKIFQNHYYAIEGDRISINGKLDKLSLDFKGTSSELITLIQVSNNSVSNRLAQEANSLQELIDSSVTALRHQLDTNLMAEDRDKIVNYLDERAQQLDDSLFIGHSENQITLENYVQNLIADINSNVWPLENDLNILRNQLEQLTTVNKLRANRLSIQTYKTLEPVESLLSSLAKKLQRTVESIRV